MSHDAGVNGFGNCNDDRGEGDDGYGGWNDVDGCIDVCCGDK